MKKIKIRTGLNEEIKKITRLISTIESKNTKPITEEEKNISDPTKEEMLGCLEAEFGGFEGYDTFSAEEAIYWYAYNNHGGQWSNLYSTLSASKYKPGHTIKNIEDSDDEISIAMYNTLVDVFGGEPINFNNYEFDYDEDLDEGQSGGSLSYEEAKNQAMLISAKEGVVLHVNQVADGVFDVSDWFDSDFTIISFENGRQL